MGTSEESLDAIAHDGDESSSDDSHGAARGDAFDLQSLLDKTVPPSATARAATLSDRPVTRRKLPPPRNRMSTRRWGEDGQAAAPAPAADPGSVPPLPLPLARKKHSSLPPALPTARGISALPKPREGSPASRSGAALTTANPGRAPSAPPARPQYRSRPPLADFESALGPLGAPTSTQEDELRIPSWPPPPSIDAETNQSEPDEGTEHGATSAPVRTAPPPLPSPKIAPAEIEPAEIEPPEIEPPEIEPPEIEPAEIEPAVHREASAETGEPDVAQEGVSPPAADEQAEIPGIADLFGAEAERPIEDELGIGDVVAAADRPADSLPEPRAQTAPRAKTAPRERADSAPPLGSGRRWARDAVMFALGLAAAVMIDRLVFDESQPPPLTRPADATTTGQAMPTTRPTPTTATPSATSTALPSTSAAPAPSVSAAVSASSAPPADGPPFNAAAATVVLKSAGRAAGACAKRSGKAVGVDVTVTFAPDGRVKEAHVGGVYGNTSFGRCVASVMKKIRIPAFGGHDATVTERVSIR